MFLFRSILLNKNSFQRACMKYNIKCCTNKTNRKKGIVSGNGHDSYRQIGGGKRVTLPERNIYQNS